MTHKEFTDKILVFKKKPWRKHKKHSRVEEKAHGHRHHHKRVEEKAHGHRHHNKRVEEKAHGHRHHHKRLIAEIEEKI